MNKYDIIGDIHGHADTLRALLTKLAYKESDGAYSHPERKVVFVGDFIDRGPKIRATLQIVRAMVEAGTAKAVMGNHEYNAICFHTSVAGGSLRPHTDEKVRQHQATLDQIATPFSEEWREWLAWFKTLPLFLDLGGLRVVHACWDAHQIAFLKGSSRLTDELLHQSARKGTAEHRALEVLLKGKEINLPKGYIYTSKEGFTHRKIRVKWWLKGGGKTYADLALPAYDDAPRLPVRFKASLESGYAESEPPVIVGHYWLPPATPAPLAANIACVDYSVAKEGGYLTAYRWDGESILNGEKFVSVPRHGPLTARLPTYGDKIRNRGPVQDADGWWFHGVQYETENSAKHAEAIWWESWPFSMFSEGGGELILECRSRPPHAYFVRGNSDR